MSDRLISIMMVITIGVALTVFGLLAVIFIPLILLAEEIPKITHKIPLFSKLEKRLKRML